MVTAQETYFAEYNTHFDGVFPDAGFAMSPSQDVTINLVNVSNVGWAAWATHAGAAGKTCSIFYGATGPVAPATVEGSATCD